MQLGKIQLCINDKGIRGMTNEDFYEAAIRHWIDGIILDEKGEYDNAVCMYGFAAECALKKIMDMLHVMNDVKRYNHFGEELFQDIKMILLGDLELTIFDYWRACHRKDGVVSNIDILRRPELYT